MTIVSCHVEGNVTEELRKHLIVEIKSASDENKVESVFPLPISNFFQVKALPKGKYLLRLRSVLPSSSLKFDSDIIEVDLEKNTQIHVGPIGFRIEEDQLKQVSFFFSASFIFCFFYLSFFLFSWRGTMFLILMPSGIDAGTSFPTNRWSFSYCIISQYAEVSDIQLFIFLFTRPQPVWSFCLVFFNFAVLFSFLPMPIPI